MTVRRVLTFVLAVLGVILAVPAPAIASDTVDYVVVVGAAGLRWNDLNPTDTPHLWRLAQQGSIGAMAVRSDRRLTCPMDGWLTLGAGNYARRPPFSPDPDACPQEPIEIEEPSGEGGFIRDQPDVIADNRGRPWRARPGALAESVRCSTAVGTGAAVALARSLGRVDRYEAFVPPDLSRLLAQCALSAVDAGTVAGSGADRQRAVRNVDANLGKALAARPENSLLLVAGVSDTQAPSGLHVAIADGPGFDGGWLISPSTNQAGYLQLVDIAPTVLSALGRAQPAKLFLGQPIRRADEQRPADLAKAVVWMADADQAAGAVTRIADTFFVIVVAVQLTLLVAAVPILRWLRRTRSRHPVPPPPRWLSSGVEIALLASALAIPAALAAELVPWWRTSASGWTFAWITLLVLAALTASVWLSALGRRPLGPLALVAAIATVLIGVDVVTGARLQLNSVAGYSVLDGDRYTGLGTVGFGVFAAGLLLGAACLAQRLVGPRWRPAVVLAVGAVGVAIVGTPWLGADPGGAIALTMGVCVAAALARGGWLTAGRMSTIVGAGVMIGVVLLLVELARPAGERGTLGRLVTEPGHAQVVLQRLSQTNVVASVTSPLTLLALVGGLFGYLVLLRSWGGLRRVYGLFPALRGGVLGMIVACALGSLMEGSGAMALGAAAATAVPVLLVGGLRVVRHVPEVNTGERPVVKKEKTHG